MKYGKVRQFYLKTPELVMGSHRVRVHEKPMFSQNFRQDDGSFPNVIAPDAYPIGKPHYWFDLHEQDQDITTYCDYLYVDDEDDGFLVQAQHWGYGEVQVRIHSNHHTWYTPHLVQSIARRLRHSQVILPLLEAALKQRLNLKSNNEVLQPVT